MLLGGYGIRRDIKWLRTVKRQDRMGIRTVPVHESYRIVTETGVRTVKRQVWTVKGQNRDNNSYRTGQDRTEAGVRTDKGQESTGVRTVKTQAVQV